MPNRLWDYKTAADLTASSIYYYQANGISQALVSAEDGTLLYHVIEETENPDWIYGIMQTTGCKDYYAMLFNHPFILAPKSFIHAEIPNFLESNFTSINLDEQVFIKYDTGVNHQQIHAAVPLYFYAKNAAISKNNYVLVVAQNKAILVFYFNHGKCELGNVFPAENDSEMLYFAVAAIKNAGLNAQQCQFEIMANATEQDAIIKTFKRFLAMVSPAEISLPYAVGEYPPYAVESFLLYSYSQCELPAVSL